MLVREFLDKNKTVIRLQLPYSPDLTSADIFLFPKLKTEEETEATIEEIKEKSKQELFWRYQKSRFRSVSRIGKNTGISVLCLKGVTFKGIR